MANAGSEIPKSSEQRTKENKLQDTRKNSKENQMLMGCLAGFTGLLTTPFAAVAAKGIAVTIQTGDLSNLPACSGAGTMVFGGLTALFIAASRSFGKDAKEADNELKEIMSLNKSINPGLRRVPVHR